MENVGRISAEDLAPLVRNEKTLLVDSRTFCEYNTSHVFNSINVWSSKIRKKRLQQSSVSVLDFMQQACQVAFQDGSVPEVIVYDQAAREPTAVPQDSFLYVLLLKLTSKFNRVLLLEGGYLEFQAKFPELCEDTSQKMSPLTSLSQPCLPVTKCGATRILPFLYLGSQSDANNKEMLRECNISYELNVSNSCPKPEFMKDSHFLRIPVNDNFSEKLLPHFGDAFQFIDKVRERGERVLVHCLAGISRSPTVAIAYVMKHLKLHYDEAYRYVKQRRATISPNINFVGQLLELDRKFYGDAGVCRSPTIPMHMDQEYCFDVLSCPDSLVRKSSSSPCIDSAHSQQLPKRSLPYLSADGPCKSPQSAFPFEYKDKDTYYVSDRLPSSPTTPLSAEYFEAYSVNPIPIHIEHCPTDSNVDPYRFANVDAFRDQRKQSNVVNPINLMSKLDSRDTEENSTSATKCRLLRARCGGQYSTRDSVEKDESTDQSVRVINIVCESPTSSQTIDSVPKLVEQVVSDVNVERQYKNLAEGSCDSLLPSHKPPIPPDEHSSSHLTDAALTSGIPPPVPKASVSVVRTSKKTDLKTLPRCHSSSETHLNARRLLETGGSCATDACATRKSFSTDEVSRGYSGVSPQSQLVLSRDSLVASGSTDLARCDSWSTSGLGSEISDWESVQGENTPALNDDANGPFDAVFAELFPGDSTDTSYKEPPRRSNSGAASDEGFDQKSSTNVPDPKVVRGAKPRPHRPLTHSCSMKSQPPQRILCRSSSAPRPVSLPGVTGSYNAQLKSSSIDMGVELDERPGWPSESNKELKFEAPKDAKPVVVHPPVSPRTMGDDVKHFMTWFKIESWQDAALPKSISEKTISDTGSRVSYPREVPVSVDDVLRCEERNVAIENENEGQSKIPSGYELQKFSRFDSKRHSYYSGQKLKDFEFFHDFTQTVPKGRDGPAKNWQWWDDQLKKKIEAIERNVTTPAWSNVSSNIDLTYEQQHHYPETLAGYHLTEELMQSVEHLLETEIGDIKRQAGALKTKFGLDSKSESCSSETSEPAERKSSTVSFSNEETVSNCSESSMMTEPLRPSNHLQSDLPMEREQAASSRAMSEPPLCAEEGLYRARSCPGLPQDKGDQNVSREQSPQAEGAVVFRSNRPPLSHKEPNRYSCGALDSLPPNIPSFESCPDISKLRRYFLENSPNSSSTSCSSSHSSFSRLLQVS